MPFIAETGEGLSNATSYTTVEFADSFHDGNGDWLNLPDATKQDKLNQATQVINLMYGTRFVSSKYSKAQALDFPRVAYTDRDGFPVINEIPAQLQKATAVLALKLANEEVELYPQPNAAGNIKATSTTVGDIQTSIEYHTPVKQEAYEGYGEVELHLAAVLKAKRKVWNINL